MYSSIGTHSSVSTSPNYTTPRTPSTTKSTKSTKSTKKRSQSSRSSKTSPGSEKKHKNIIEEAKIKISNDSKLIPVIISSRFTQGENYKIDKIEKQFGNTCHIKAYRGKDNELCVDLYQKEMRHTYDSVNVHGSYFPINRVVGDVFLKGDVCYVDYLKGYIHFELKYANHSKKPHVTYFNEIMPNSNKTLNYESETCVINNFFGNIRSSGDKPLVINTIIGNIHTQNYMRQSNPEASHIYINQAFKPFHRMLIDDSDMEGFPFQLQLHKGSLSKKMKSVLSNITLVPTNKENITIVSHKMRKN